MIPIGCDHAGFQTKQAIIEHLSEDSIDYPDYAHPVAEHIEKNPGTIGILLCGSGNGISMTANKHQEIRSALCWKKEIAELARQHNDANIITLPARFITIEEAIEMVDTFLNTPFEGGRHANRVAKISC